LPDRLQAWIDHVFAHLVPEYPKEKEWYWAHHARLWKGSLKFVPTLIAEMCERSGELLARFSDAQLDQGFWYLVGPAPPDFIETLLDSNIPISKRVRTIRSFTPLFEQVMAVRCSPHLNHLGKLPEKPPNESCWMWWDLIWYGLCHDFDRLTPQIAAEIVAALRRQLTIPHDACRVSALHGIGHWVRTIPEAAGLVDEFLAANPGLRPELVEYAQRARAGQVL
jgi:hypothetical protein